MSNILRRVAWAGIAATALSFVAVTGGSASAATPAYHNYSADFQTNWPSVLGSVHIQAGWRANGQDVYLNYLYVTPEGYGETVTWHGATGGGSSNLTFGENDTWCIGPFGIGCFNGGYRVTVNRSGQIVNAYGFGE